MKQKTDKAIQDFLTSSLHYYRQTVVEPPTALPTLNGKMGTCLLYFALSRYHTDPVIFQYGQTLLNDISEQAATLTDLNWGYGLAGIGWGIEYIISNNFISENSDDVLSSVDDVLYKYVLYAPEKKLSLHEGMIGFCHYFMARYYSKNKGTHRYLKLPLHECLAILIDNIVQENTAACQEELQDIVVFTARFMHQRIKSRSLASILQKSVNLLSDHMGALSKEKNKSNQALPMAVALCYAGHQHSINHWKSKAFQWLHEIIPGIRTDILSSQELTAITGNLCRMYHFEKKSPLLNSKIVDCLTFLTPEELQKSGQRLVIFDLLRTRYDPAETMPSYLQWFS